MKLNRKKCYASVKIVHIHNKDCEKFVLTFMFLHEILKNLYISFNISTYIISKQLSTFIKKSRPVSN